MKKKQTKEKQFIVRLTDQEYEQLESLATLTGRSMNDVVRASIKISKGKVRKDYLKEFMKRVKEMPDPFDSSSPYNVEYINNSIDQSDVDLVIN